jgi:hypothetical protein
MANSVVATHTRVQVPLAGGGVQFVWTGDRWQTAPDHLLVWCGRVS